MQLLPGYPRVRVLVALSGGVDSTALLAALARDRPQSLRLRAVHVNHGLHPNARKWSAHCRALAQTLHVPLTVRTARIERVKGESLEAAARAARYRLLADELRCDEYLLSAHHQDDQLETVLLQLFRGAGVAGLAAMPEIAAFASGWLVRPLLSRTRAELERWARAAAVEWIEDDTNTDERLDRNYLRRCVLPLIRARWQGVGAAVARSARHAAEGQQLLDEVARGDVERAAVGADLSVKVLRGLPVARRKNALRFWISRSGGQLPDARRLEQLAVPVLEARIDAQPLVGWDGISAQRHADLLSLRVRSQRTRRRASFEGNAAQPAEMSWPWRQSPRVPLPDGRGSLELKPGSRGPIDLDTLPAVMTIRWRAGGERLRPRRGGPRRTLKSLLQESHLPIAERQRLPLLYSGATLLAAGARWLDASIQAGPESRNRGRLRVTLQVDA
ncbi:MAG TPA: tRNA lysidine(34) synthetase TilS [Steroidobacteraceae bacterium]